MQMRWVVRRTRGSLTTGSLTSHQRTAGRHTRRLITEVLIMEAWDKTAVSYRTVVCRAVPGRSIGPTNRRVDPLDVGQTVVCNIVRQRRVGSLAYTEWS